MRSGVRLTFLDHCDNLMGMTWQYQGFVGTEAIIQKLNHLFYYINKIGFTDIIDTVNINKDSNNKWYLDNTGVNGFNITMDERFELYHKLCSEYDINIICEIQAKAHSTTTESTIPLIINNNNYESFGNYVVQLISTYSFIKYWQILVTPEEKQDDEYWCSPETYVKLMKHIYDGVQERCPDVKLGGPGCYRAVVQYLNSSIFNNSTYEDTWLSQAMNIDAGNEIGINPNPNIPFGGFLPYISFFSYQGNRNGDVFFYNNYKDVINILRQHITEKYQGIFQVSPTFNYFSTLQGHEGNPNRQEEMDLQAYRDIREMMQDLQCNVIPFKKQIVDECDSTDATKTENAFGLIYASTVKTKPAYNQFKFVFEKIREYKYIVPIMNSSTSTDDVNLRQTKRPFDIDEKTNVEFTMFMDTPSSKEATKLLTIIYPTNIRTITNTEAQSDAVTFKPGTNRTLYTSDGIEIPLVTYTEKKFYKTDFYIVEEELKSNDNSKNAAQEARARMRQYKRSIEHLLEAVPSDYNKEVYDTNWYKLLRSVAIEFGDAEYEKQILEDNIYLSTAHGDAIFNKFGILIGVTKKTDWTEEQYRNIVSAILESLFKGATKQSIKKALYTYVTTLYDNKETSDEEEKQQWDVNVYEMFQDYSILGINREDNWDNQYKFTVSIDKPISSDVTNETVINNIREILDIIKPAHTLPIIVLALTVNEDYQDWYLKHKLNNFTNSDELNKHLYNFNEANAFGYKAINYDNTLHLSNVDLNYSLNSIYKLSPKYTLYDNHFNIFNIHNQEYYNFFEDEVLTSIKLKDYNDKYNFETIEKEKIHYQPYLREQKYGYDVTNENLLQYGNYKKYNNHVTGFKYKVKDELLMMLSTPFAYIENQYEIKGTKFNFDSVINNQELYNKYDDVNQNNIMQELTELKFGWQLDNTMRTFSPSQTKTNKHHYGVRYTVQDTNKFIFNPKFDDIYNSNIENGVTRNTTSKYNDKYDLNKESFKSKHNMSSYKETFTLPPNSDIVGVVKSYSDIFDKNLTDDYILTSALVDTFITPKEYYMKQYGITYTEQYHNTKEKMITKITLEMPDEQKFPTPKDNFSHSSHVGS